MVCGSRTTASRHTSARFASSAERIVRESYASRLNEVTGFEQQETHDEYAILDRAGRLQIPREMLDQLGVKGNQVRVEMENGRIILTAPREEEKKDNANG